jgi:glycerol-3-phosphate acyltransferase PlsY
MAILIIFVGYLLGSIPFAYIAGRMIKGIDIRTVGTRNVGGHNVMLEVGRLAGCVVGLLDMGKGALPVFLARQLGLSDLTALLGGMAAVLGHNYPIFLGFRGGKGLGSSLGILLTLMPLETLLILPLFAVLYIIITRSISFSALVSLLSISALAWFRDKPLVITISPLLLLLLMGIAILPDGIRMWRAAEDKRHLILHKWISDREARI